MTTGTKSLPKRLRLLGYKTYSEYLKSDHWQELRKRFFRESKRAKRMMKKYGFYVCEFCRQSKKVNLHHATYKRLGKEHLGDLHLICDDCHELIHKNSNGKGIWRLTFEVRRFRKGLKYNKRLIKSLPEAR